MFCLYCGKEIKDESVYCKFCGKKVEKSKADILDENLNELGVYIGSLFIPLSSFGTIDEKAKYLQEIGLEAFKKNEFNEAIEYFDKSIEINPNFSSAIRYKALVKATIEKYDEALLDLKRVIEINPSDYKAYCLMGDIYLANKRNTEAISNLDKAIKINSSYQDSYLLRAKCYYNLNKMTEALNDFLMAEKLGNLYAEDFCLLGCIYEVKNDLSKAIESWLISNFMGFQSAKEILAEFNVDFEIKLMAYSKYLFIKHPQTKKHFDTFLKSDNRLPINDYCFKNMIAFFEFYGIRIMTSGGNNNFYINGPEYKIIDNITDECSVDSKNYVGNQFFALDKAFEYLNTIII